MPYELTLQPKSSSSLSEEELREKLLSIGLHSDPNLAPPGLLFEGSVFLLIEEGSVSPSVSITANLPYCLPLEDACRKLMALTMLAFLVDAEVRDGDTIIDVSLGESSPEDLASILIPFCERYNRAFDVAVRIFGRAGG